MCPDMFTFDKERTNARYGHRPNHRHEYRWSSNMGKWVCIKCARLRRSQAKEAKATQARCSLNSHIMAEAHPTHHMYRSFEERNNIPLIFCWKCGCYAQARSEGLKNRCKKKAYHSTIRNRLQAGLHPRTKAGLQGTTKVMCSQQMARQWPHVHGGTAEGPGMQEHTTWEPFNTGPKMNKEELLAHLRGRHHLHQNPDTAGTQAPVQCEAPPSPQAPTAHEEGLCFTMYDEGDPEVDAFFDLPWGIG